MHGPDTLWAELKRDYLKSIKAKTRAEASYEI
jgi:hypothetical protein